MRYSESPDWAYRADHPVVHALTRQQANAAIKQVPSFKLGQKVAEALKDSLGRTRRQHLVTDSWTYIRKRDGSTWLISTALWNKRCFEVPATVAERFEELYSLVENW